MYSSGAILVASLSTSQIFNLHPKLLYMPKMAVPKRVTIPNCVYVQAEILGVDTASFFHLDILEPSCKATYNLMLGHMESAVNGQPHMERSLSKKPGTKCIVKHAGRRGGDLVRATIIQAVPKGDYVFCNLIDEFTEEAVHYTKIFHTTEEVLRFPIFVFKCKLTGMDCFAGDQCMRKLYTEYINSEWKLGSNSCTVVKTEDGCKYPTVSMLTCEKMLLTGIFRQLLWQTQSLSYPGIGLPVKARILHFDDLGVFWYRPIYEGGQIMINAIRKRLDSGLNWMFRKCSANAFGQNNLLFNWEKCFINAPVDMYMYIQPDKARSFRVIILNATRALEGKFGVIYIDYGISRIVSHDNLVPLKMIDPTLCFIPPQCLPIKFIGAANGHFNKTKFLKFIEKSASTSIVVKEFVGVGGVNGQVQLATTPPIGDILVRNHPRFSRPGHLGHSLGEIFGVDSLAVKQGNGEAASGALTMAAITNGSNLANSSSTINGMNEGATQFSSGSTTIVQ